MCSWSLICEGAQPTTVGGRCLALSQCSVCNVIRELEASNELSAKGQATGPPPAITRHALRQLIAVVFPRTLDADLLVTGRYRVHVDPITEVDCSTFEFVNVIVGCFVLFSQHALNDKRRTSILLSCDKNHLPHVNNTICSHQIHD